MVREQCSYYIEFVSSWTFNGNDSGGGGDGDGGGGGPTLQLDIIPVKWHCTNIHIFILHHWLFYSHITKKKYTKRSHRWSNQFELRGNVW